MIQKYQIKQKIKTIDELKTIVNSWKLQDKTIVFTNGCFDILHLGHLSYLEEAAKLADRLVIGINSDASVRRLKGKDRPIHNIENRLHQIAALQMVDVVVVFDDDDPMELIKLVQPDHLVKGGDWDKESIVGAAFVESYGGSVCVLSLVEGLSTTRVIEKIQQQKKK